MSRAANLIARYSVLTKDADNITEASDEEMKQLFADFIEQAIDAGDDERVAELQDSYKERFGTEYATAKNFNPTPSLDTVYSAKDFPKHDDYMTYCDALYALRFNTYKKLLKDVDPKFTWDALVDLLAELDIKAVIERPRGTETAWVTGTDEIMFNPSYENNKACSLSTVIHELGHILDNRLRNEAIRNDLFLHNNKATSYDLNPAEIFADHFMTYFLEPKFLKAGWPDVTKYFDKAVPSLWKKSLKKAL